MERSKGMEGKDFKEGRERIYRKERRGSKEGKEKICRKERKDLRKERKIRGGQRVSPWGRECKNVQLNLDTLRSNLEF